MVKHFLEIQDYTGAELAELLHQAAEMKKLYLEGGRDLCLSGKNMAMLFEKPSSRTRMSFQVAMVQLGGAAIYARQEDIGGLGKREPIKDLARVLNGYVDVIVARTFSHDSVRELARYADIPVINALSDLAHPCQAMADMLTIQENFANLKGLKLSYIGDGNNVARSLAVACVRLGLDFVIAAPHDYMLPHEFLKEFSKNGGPGKLQWLNDPAEASKGAHVIYTDTWTSMGQEAEKEQRLKDFSGYQVNSELLQLADKDVKVMHCLPAYRGLEITDEVIESEHSIIFAQAENRLHFQRALLKYLLCSEY